MRVPILARPACFSFVLVVPLAMAPLSARATPVETSEGPVTGADDGTVTRFLGVPFAAPPVGALRFAPPAPPAAHRAVVSATRYGTACPQTASLGTPSTNEDCLTLNLFRPDRPGPAHRPVLVFLYGGSFRFGASAPGRAPAGPNYDGGRLATGADAIVVTVNYRLGVLGFLASPLLDRADPRHVSGNYGLLDQQAALRWVRANAAAFGGDPNRVMLFGQSAGALSVVEQMVSPAARGLFQAVALESPGALPSESLDRAERRDAPILDQTGCRHADDTLACLRAAPVDTLLKSGVPVGPVVDGAVIPTAPAMALETGAFAAVPTVLLTDRDEGTFFIADGVNRLGHALTATEYAATLRAAFGDADAQLIARRYPATTNGSPGQTLAAVLTDEFFACPALALRANLAPHAPVLQAEFRQNDPVRDFPVPMARGIAPGDLHTAELASVFGQDGAGHALSEPSERLLSDAMIGSLGALARSAGAAIPPGNVLPSGTVLSLRTPVSLSDDFASVHRCAFWQQSGIPPKLLDVLR